MTVRPGGFLHYENYQKILCIMFIISRYWRDIFVVHYCRDAVGDELYFVQLNLAARLGYL